jgi:long-chain acyl-CoA synthetase
MFHLADGAMTFLVTLRGGSHCFLARFDPVAMMELIARHKVTMTLIVPTMVNMLVNHPDVGKHDLTSLERLIYGASPMPEAVIRRALEVLPQTRFNQAYGQSEASPGLTLMPHEYHSFEGPFAGRLKAAGRALAGVEVVILDHEDREVPRGTVGEVCARGNAVMLGYWQQPELTARTLRNGWLHTGDGGYMDELGFVFIVDRVKDMIITGGENVYSAEVEEAVYSHPAVAECAVIGVPDPQWGERVHAVVRCKAGQEVSEAELIGHCRARIAGYKLPRSVSFTETPLPLSGAGKILKTELRKPFWEGQTRNVA